MFIFQVHHYIQPDKIEEYKTAVLENAKQTVKEPGVMRFDVFQDVADAAHFSLLEIYVDKQAQEAHLQTEHFFQWKDVYLATRERVGSGDEFLALFPPDEAWRKA